MVAVAIAALDFLAIRGFLDTPVSTLDGETAGFLLMGALPTANVLGVAILVGLRRRGSSPFLLGFVVFGAIAMAIYILLSAAPRGLLTSYSAGWAHFISYSFEPRGPLVFYSILCLVGAVMSSAPQLLFAVIGGYLFRGVRAALVPRW
jgi:hypothetical protein